MKTLTVRIDVPTEIHMTRTFAAPRKRVIEAFTRPELLKRWLGGVRAKVTACEVDFRVGGAYRYEFGLPNGSSFFFTGTFREIRDDRIVHTELFNGLPPGSVVTTSFAERDGCTTVEWVIAYESQAVRDRVLAMGMADGAGESYDELAKLLATP